MLAIRIGIAVIGILALVVALFTPRHPRIRKAAWATVAITVLSSGVAWLLVWLTDTGITSTGR